MLRLGEQIAAGLGAIHARDLAHRDLKPANILIEGNGERDKITNFCVAWAVDAAHLNQLRLIAGTLAYMSAVQAGGFPVDPVDDFWRQVEGRPGRRKTDWQGDDRKPAAVLWRKP